MKANTIPLINQPKHLPSHNTPNHRTKATETNSKQYLQTSPECTQVPQLGS